MTLKKVNFVHYGKKAKCIEINVKDNQNQTIEFFKVSNNKEHSGEFTPTKVSKILKDKYGFDFNINNENIEKDIQESSNRWLKKDTLW